jgi:hypothetical protein
MHNQGGAEHRHHEDQRVVVDSNQANRRQGEKAPKLDRCMADTSKAPTHIADALFRERGF